MNKLSQEQINFLNDQKIDLKYIFNAEGLKKDEYRKIMKDLNKFIAFNVTACKAKGHTLRTRSGHCCQCDTSKIEFQKRADSSGVTYLAASLHGEIIKVGFTKAIEVRSESLNRTKYANLIDWKILFAIKSNHAGRIENIANTELQKHFISRRYDHDNHCQEAYETFHCSYSKGRELILTICNNNKFTYEIIEDSKSNRFEFRNLIKK
ncbi:GIY-YIG nuclease family protein [Chryseobacterium sp. 2VB]|uniref:GIY-YIG nuclease family protein n=1 Tax=Chryseobacterium sp. 2VB TaxID=2502204 RepID=UPI0010F87E65|nr:GIY-YIG nuclease family protein [Chryseobacterium sp. 2VB]